MIIAQLGSCALGIYSFFEPVLLRSSLQTEIYLLHTCEVQKGVKQCGTNRESSNVCSEIDSRMRMVVTFAVVMCVSNLVTAFILLYEVTGKKMPIRRLGLMSGGWSAGANVLSIGILLTTLIANLCNSPLSFSEQGGDLGRGSWLFVGQLCLNVLPTLLYLAMPEDPPDMNVKAPKRAS
eukprot:GILI01041694.1.p1 GENE.GILI01041694.1~~GILI01041694.1.p1  ORF type:complete len:198 (-),score=0.78 GILI01041694.1:60-596(-)